MSASISLRDRRDLPFFMVRLQALQAIRNNISGPRRARALGLYVLLCQIANEQRGEGEHKRLVSTWDELARRGALSKRMLKLLSGTLNVAGVARFETRIDPLRGSMPSLIHLDVQEGSWVGLTVAAANELAESSRAPLLPALGLLTVLLELCAEQRAVLGGLRAETTRADVARRAGCSTDTLDSWVKALESVAVLDVTRRRGLDGGHLPNLWEITEPSTASQRGSARDQSSPTAPPEGNGPLAMAVARTAGAGTAPAENGNYPTGERNPPGPRNGTALAEIGHHPPGVRELPTPQTQLDEAGNGNCPSGNSASPRADPRPLNASARRFVETRSIEEQLNPQTPKETRAVGEGGDREEVRLCVELVGVLGESRGPAPGRRYAADADGWHAAAARMLADHPLAKVLEAIAYLPCDQIVGTKVRGMPDLERHIEDLRHRAHAAKATAGAAMPDGLGVLGWPEAKGALMRAVQRHGAGAKQAALVELGERDGLLPRFVERVGWGALCQSPIEKQDYAYRTSWDELTRRALEEAAA